ncbi:MATE family efflux transporter [Brucepastera parasyntrophica]|uniref:MATE family efflux transporter n=1 Tax=Brucepastera parasyntrophica TaxID=2880008 RepID=UPI0021090C52|nr:MATE family efflux transporter [Brucepastera parasyntrophica]ULQ60305.1 MATE family efflux transporter [Brucepastera parasyntrophica]
MVPIETNYKPKKFSFRDRKNSGVDRAALPMFALTLPLVFESFFRILISSVDVMMLSSHSDHAVAGVGLVSQYIFFIQLLFSVVCVGTSIVLSQYLGAERVNEAKQVAQASAVMVSAVALFMSLLVIFGAKPLLSIYTVEEEVREAAWTYLVIYGGFGSLFTAFSMLQGTILRSYGYTSDAMYISIIANIVNVIGNAFSIYGFFGFPVLGVMGVAMSSALSQIVACILLAWRIRVKPDVQLPLAGITRVPRNIYRTILSIGVPTAGESLSYNIAQIVIMAMISTFGTWAMSAQIYAQTIVRFVYATASAIGNAVQIKTGYFVGAKQPEAAYKRVYLYQGVGTLISAAAVILLNVVKTPIIGLFTKEPEIAALTSSLLLYSIYIEIGRSVNLITIPALKGAGDVRYPVSWGIVSMWLILVGGSHLLGMKMGLGLVGIWIAMGSDEFIRAIAMLFRWKSKRWQTKAIV